VRQEIVMTEGQYADVNGVRLHYVASGDAGRPLMLFLHGFPEFWYEWKHQLQEFGKDYYAVAPDMRGYNLSSRPAELSQYRIEHLVEDVRQLAANLLRGTGRTTFTLVAHDWGGGVAWAFAIAHPELLERLIIINMAHPATFGREMQQNPAQQRASQYMIQFRGTRADDAFAADNYAGLFERVFGPLMKSGRFSEADRQAYIEAWSRPGGLTGGLNYYRANEVGPPSQLGPAKGNYAIDPATTTVRVPALVIWGEQDQALLTGNLDGLEEFVPDLIVHRVPDGSHWIVHEQPERINQYIRDFLGRG
jgi:epoxide hydrolase 4